MRHHSAIQSGVRNEREISKFCLSGEISATKTAFTRPRDLPKHEKAYGDASIPLYGKAQEKDGRPPVSHGQKVSGGNFDH
jgi:hypothetical protein